MVRQPRTSHSGSSSTAGPGVTLPAEAQLCETFNAARGSVAQDLRSLVIDRVPSQSFDRVISFTEWCRSSGVVPGQQTQLLAKVRAYSVLAAALDVPVPTQVVVVKRLRLMDGEPALVERLRYRMEFGQHVLGFDPDSGSIYQHLMNHGVEIHWAIRTIDTIAADADGAERLKAAAGSPPLRIRRRPSTLEGVPVEASDDRYLPSRASFALHSMRGILPPLTMIPGD